MCVRLRAFLPLGTKFMEPAWDLPCSAITSLALSEAAMLTKSVTFTPVRRQASRTFSSAAVRIGIVERGIIVLSRCANICTH
jgi:hypothetical protein